MFCTILSYFIFILNHNFVFNAKYRSESFRFGFVIIFFKEIELKKSFLLRIPLLRNVYFYQTNNK